MAVTVSVMSSSSPLTEATAAVWFSLPYRYTMHSPTDQCNCNLCKYEQISVTVICVSVMCTALTLTEASAAVWFSLPYRYTMHSRTDQCNCNLCKHEQISVTVIWVSVMCTALTLTAATAAVWFSVPHAETQVPWSRSHPLPLCMDNREPATSEAYILHTCIHTYNTLIL